jgi:hypothetical protein
MNRTGSRVKSPVSTSELSQGNELQKLPVAFHLLTCVLGMAVLFSKINIELSEQY